MARYAAFLGLVGILTATLTIANLRRDPDSVRVDWRIVKEPPIEVRVEAPSRGLIARKITAPGVVEAIEEAKIGPQILGRVVAVHVNEGEIVKAGDVLVKLDDTDARSRLLSSQARSDRLRAAIDQAESELAQANREEVQHSRLASRGFSTPKDLADARTRRAKSEAALEMSRREFTESEALRRISLEELNRTAIKAPIDGVVTGVSVRVGEVVIAGTMNLPGSVLMTISDIAHMRVSADVDESDVPSIIPGQPALVYLQAEEQPPIPATVEKIASRGRKTGDAVSFETRVRVDHPPPALRAAMTATAEIEVRRIDDALGVPVQAVVHRRRKELPDTSAVRAWAERHARSPGEKARDAASRYIKVVFVLEGGVARARPVETGISDERRVEIVSGLAADDRVIVGPFRALDQLRDGQAVRVEVDAPVEKP
jgi:HlyD family secretion protein